MLEIKPFSAWSQDHSDTTPTEQYRGYSSYLRSAHFKNGTLNEQTENEINEGMYQKAVADGLIAEDAPEEEKQTTFKSLVGAEAADPAPNNAKFLPDYLRYNFDRNSPEYAQAGLVDQYLAAQRINSPLAAQHRADIEPLLSNQEMINASRKAAVDRGDVPVISYTTDKGEKALHFGANATRENLTGQVDSLLSLGALDASDLSLASKYLEPLNGGVTNNAQAVRADAAFRFIAETVNSDESLKKNFGNVVQKNRRDQQVEDMSMGERALDLTKQAIAVPFGIASDVIVGTGKAVGGLFGAEYAPEEAPASFDLSKAKTTLQSKGYSAEEVDRYVNDYLKHSTGPVYRADKPASGFDTDSLGNVLIAPELVGNTVKFDQALAVADLNEDQKSQAPALRRGMLEKLTPEYLDLVVGESPEALEAFNAAKAKGISSTDFLESWLSDEKNYDGFSERLQQFGLSTLSAVAQPVLGVFALGGSESAAKGLASLNREAAQRQKYSRLYGDEYGLGFQIANTLPQVGADILLSVGTGAAYTGLKATVSGGIKGVLRNASKQAVSELGEDAALAVSRASTLTGSTSEAFSKVSQGLAKSLNLTEAYAPVAASSFIRSASSTYGQLYDELPEDMSHEDKHKAVLGTSILSGLSTMVTVVGMGLLGRGGVEDIATGGLRIGGKTVPMNKLTYRQMKMFADETSPIIGKLTDKAFQQSLRASMGSAYRNFFSHTLKGGFDEAVEEMLDQSIQIKITDAYKNQDTPFSDFASQLWTAGVIGGALGGGMGAGGQLLSRPTENDVIRAASAQYDLLSRATERLQASGSPVTAGLLKERMDEAAQRLSEERAALATANAQAAQTDVPESSTLNPDFGKATEDPELPRPAYTELLTDLEGQTVKHGRYSGRVVIEEDQAYLELDKPEMGPDQKQFSRLRLGSAIDPASNTVSRSSSFRVLDTPVKGFAAGTPFYQKGKTRFVLPDPATADIERDFHVIRNENQRVVSIVVKAARSFDKSEVSVPRTVDSPSDMRVLGRIYGIDVDPDVTQERSFRSVGGDFKPVRSIAKQSPQELTYDPASIKQDKKGETWAIEVNEDSQPIVTILRGKREVKVLLPPTEEMRPMAAQVLFKEDNTVDSLFFRNTLQAGASEPTPYFERDPERIQQLARLYNLRLDGNDSPSEAFVDDKNARFSFLDNMAGAQLPPLPVVNPEAGAAEEEVAAPIPVGEGQLELGLEGGVPDYADRISKAGMAKAVAAAAAQVATLRANLPEGASTAIADLTSAEKEATRARASLATAQTQLDKATDKTREARTATVATRTDQLAAAEQKLAAARKAPSLKASAKVAAAEKRLQDLQAAFDRIEGGEMAHLLGEQLTPEQKLEYSAAVAAAYPVDETAEDVMNTILSLDPAPRARTARRIAQQTYEGFTPEQIEGAVARADAMIDFGIARLEDESAPADVAREIITAGEIIKSRIATFQGVVEDEIDLRRFRQIEDEGQRLLDQYEADVAKANSNPETYSAEELEADYARFEQMSDEEFASMSERIASNRRPRLAARLSGLRARKNKETALPSVEEVFNTPEVEEEIQSGEPDIAVTVDSFPEVLSRFNALIQDYKEAVLTAQGEAITKGKSKTAATRAAGQIRSSIQPQLKQEALRIINLIRQNNELDDVVRAEYETEVLRTVGRNFDEAVSRLLNSKKKVERTMSDAPKFKGVVKKTGVGFRTKQDKELFDLLASNGQIVTDLTGLGELLPDYRAVVNNVVYNPFTMASPDLQKDGARYYKPSDYVATKKRMLAERVQELYPETGYLRKAAGKRGGYEYVVGKQVYPTVYATGVKGYMRALKKDGDPNKASDFTYIEGAYAPYASTNRQTDTFDGGDGVFTNNPVAVRAQLAKGMTIDPFPKSFKKRNPSIALNGDQPVGFYLPTDLGLTEPLYGDSKLANPKFADRGGSQGPNATSLGARQTSKRESLDALFLLDGGMIRPSPRTPLGEQYYREELSLVKSVGRLLDSNANRPLNEINYRLPVTPEGIGRVVDEITRELTTSFQEARLARLTAQYVAKQLVQKVRKGQELSPDMVAYMEAKDISAEIAPPTQLKEIVTLYAKDADGSLGSAASVVNITAFMKDMFKGMTIDELADHITTLYPETTSPDATGVLTKYAQKLLLSVTPTGDYYTLPTAQSVRARSANRHINTAAAAERRGRQMLSNEIAVSSLEILGVLDRNDVTVYSSQYRGEDDPQGEQDRFSENSMARAFEQLEGGVGDTVNTILGFRGRGVEPIRLPAEENNPLLYTKSDLLTDDFRRAVRENPAVASLIKQLAMKYDPELAVLNGVELLSKLSGKVAEQEAEMNPAAFQFLRALQNKNTQVGAIGQRLAAHLVLSGWLPPSSMYRLSSSVTRRPDGTLVVSSNVPVKTRIGMLSPSEHATYIGATSDMTPEQILEKGAEARQVAANEFKDTFGKSEAEATEEHNAFVEAARLAQSTLLTLNQERLLRINEASLAQFRVGQLQDRLTLLIGSEADMNAEEAINAGVANQQALLKSLRSESRELYGKARRVDKDVEQAVASAADLPALLKQRQEFSDLLDRKPKAVRKWLVLSKNYKDSEFPSTEIASRIVGLDRLILKVEAMSHPSKVAALRAESRQYRDEARALADRAKRLKDLPIRSLLLNTAQELREFVSKANMSTEAANMLSQQAKDVLALAQSKPYQMLADVASTDPAYLREKGKLTSLTDAERNIIAQAFLDKQSGKQSQDRLASATKSLAKFLKDYGFNVRSRQTTQQAPEDLFTTAEAPVIPPPPAGVTEFRYSDLGVLPEGAASNILVRREVRAEEGQTVIEYTYLDGSVVSEVMEGLPSTGLDDLGFEIPATVLNPNFRSEARTLGRERARSAEAAEREAVQRGAAINQEGLQSAANMEGTISSKVVSADGYVARNGVLLRDDGGAGDLNPLALQLPDGSLILGTAADIPNVVYDRGLSLWGVKDPTQTRKMSPSNATMTMVRFGTSPNAPTNQYRPDTLLVSESATAAAQDQEQQEPYYDQRQAAALNNPENFNPQLGRVAGEQTGGLTYEQWQSVYDYYTQEREGGAGLTNPESFLPRLSRLRPEPSFLGEFRSAGIFTTQTKAEIVAANQAEADRLGLVSGDIASVISALREIAKSGKPVQKAVASMLLANPSIIANSTFVMAEFNRVDAGFYVPDTNTVAINLDGTNGRGLADVLLHEYIHAGTLSLIQTPQTRAQREAVQRLTALRNLTSQIAAQRGIDSAVFRAGLANNAEFVTYSLTAPEFQAILAQLSPPSQRSIWQRILDTIADFFGAGRETVNNALDEILNFTSMAFTTPNTFGESVSLGSARDQDALAPQVARAERAEVAARAAVVGVEGVETAPLTPTLTLYIGGSSEIKGNLSLDKVGDNRAYSIAGFGVNLAEKPELAEKYATGENGTVHSVGLNVPMDTLLDWLATYDSQSGAVKAGLKAIAAELGVRLEGLDGLAAYDAVAEKLGSRRAASEMMAKYGINGSVFSDPKTVRSRGRVFVIFNESAMSAPIALSKNTEGTYIPRTLDPSSSNAYFAEGLTPLDPIELARVAMPQGVEMVEDPQLAGVAGFSRANPNQILVNPDTLAQSIKGLPAHKAAAVVRSAIDEEVAHMAADSVFSEADYADIAEMMGETGLNLVAHEYYSLKHLSFAERSAAIRADRESGILSDVTLAAEWTRMQVSRMATGTTRERDLDMILDNKSLVDKLVTALLRFVETLRERFALSPTASTAAKISQASRMMRRLRNDGVLPTPEPSPEGEMGDTTYLLAALSNQTVEGQEDRTSFAVPVAAVNPESKSFIDRFWDTVGERGRIYNMPTALRNVYNDRAGTLSSAQYDIQVFNKKFSRLRDVAMANGIPMENLMVVLGTTEPIVSTPEQARIRRELRAYKDSLSPQDPDFEQKVREKENDLSQGAALTFRAAFRVKQEAMENDLRARGYDEIVDLMVDFRKRMNKLKTVVKWDSTNDVYLTRLYRYYDTPGWHMAVNNGTVFTDDTGTEIDFGARRWVAAHRLFEEEVRADLQSKGIASTPDLIGQRVLAKLDEKLKYLDTLHAEEYSPSMASSIRQDTNLLKNKKDVDEAMRELLGEVKDPLEVAVRTMHSLGRMAANKAFYDSFESIAISQGLASNTPKDGMDLLFPSRQSDRYGNLAGLYVRKDIANALREELDLQLGGGKSNATGAIASLTKGLTTFSGLAITAKTALGVGYWTRNIIGGGLLTVSQGLTPISRDSLASFKSAWKGNFIGAESDENQREVIRRLTELQILRDDTQGRMITDMMRGFMTNPDQALDEALQMILESQATGNMEKVKTVWNKLFTTPIEKVTSVSATLNNFVDSFFKTNAYFQELRLLKDKFGDTHSEAELEQRAAHKVKLTFPTHSQTLDITRAFNRSPLALLFLPFLRWKTEIVRTMINTPLLAASEMKNGEFTRGLRRLAGFSTVVGGGGTIMGNVIAMIFGMLGDDDEDKDGRRKLTAEEQEQIRLGIPKWQRLHALHMTKLGGSIQVVDLHNILPHSVVTGFFSLAIDAARTGKGIPAKEMAAFLKTEVLGSNIAATAVNEALNNRDDFGRAIYNESDSPLVTMGKWLGHIGLGTITPAVISKTVGPYGMFRKGEKNRLEMALGELTGTRPQLHELNMVLDRGMRTVKQGLDEAVGVRAPLLSGKALDLNEIPEIFDKQQRMLNANQKSLSDLLRVMQSLGVEESMIFEKTKDTGLSKQKVALAMEGQQLRYTPNAQVYQKMDTSIKALGEEESAEPRFQRLLNYAETQPEIYDVSSY